MFGVRAWKSVDPVTSLKADDLTEAKKKLPVGTIKISSVHPKSKKKPQIRVFVQTETELKYIGTLGATKGPTKGVAEKFLKDNGVSLSDLPTGPKWNFLFDPKEGKGAAAAPKEAPKAEPEKKLKKDHPEPKKTVTTKQQAAYNNIYQDVMHKSDSDLSPEEKKIVDDLKYGLEGVPPDADAEAVYKAWLDLHTGMTADEMEKDYGKDWSEKAWAMSAALSKYKGGPGDKEWEAEKAKPAQKKPEPPKTGALEKALAGALSGFGQVFQDIKAGGGHSAVGPKMASAYAAKYGSDWADHFKLAQVIDSAGGADKLAQMAALHASMAKSLELSYGPDWQAKAKVLHKEIYGKETGELPTPATAGAPPASPEAQPKDIEDPGVKAAKVKVEKPKVTAAPPPPPPSGYTPPPGGSPAASLKVPSPKNLKKVGGAEGLGGAGQKQFYQDAQGNKYLFKLATKKGTGKPDPMRAFVQSAFSGIAKAIKPAHPKIETVRLDGKVGAIYPFLPSGTPHSLQGQSPSDLSPSEAWDVAEEHVIDWMMSQHDSHPGNFLRTEDGRIIGIDKEQGFKYFPDDKLDIDYHPNAKYNETEPFYNTFWRDWTKGKVNFDPQKLGASIDKAMAITPEDFFNHLRPYAEQRFPNDKMEQENFLRKAYNRKNTLKRDFEQFFSGLYEKKTGEKGSFTFAGGFIPESEKDKPYTKIQVTPEKTETAAQMLATLGGNTKPYKPKGGEEDPTKITVRSTASEEEFRAMLDKLGFKDATIKTGSHYKLAFLDRKAWEAASVTTPEKKEEITIYPTKTIQPHSGNPTYFSAVKPFKEIEPNSDELKTITKRKDLGRNGARITLDGGSVENQVASVKRRKDASGKDYYEVIFRLRKSAAKPLRAKGTSETIGFPVGDKYDAEADAVLDGVPDKDLTFGEYKGFSAQTYSVPNGEMSMVNNQYDAVMDGMVRARVRPKPGQNVHEALTEMLNSVSPKLGKEVVRDPKPEEREMVKLRKLMWSYAPQKHDSLKKSDMTIPKLRGMLKEAGLTDEEIDSAKEVETLDHQTTWALPGRWRRDGAKKSGPNKGKPVMRFLNWNASSPNKIVNMLKTGPLGAPERVLTGLGYFGTDHGKEFHNGLDGMTWRLATNLKEGDQIETSYGPFNIVVPPDEIDRLDCGPLYSGDTWGCLNPKGDYGSTYKNRKPLEEALTLPSYNTASSEVVVRKGINPQRILRITTTATGYGSSKKTAEENRQILLKEMQKAGITEVNGIPIEDFVVPASTVSEIYEKFVKPAGF
jgi:hypothetical protein